MGRRHKPTVAEVAAYAAAMRCSDEWARRTLSRVDDALRERIVRAAISQRPEDGNLLHDPIEDEPQLASILAVAEREAEASIDADAREQMGYCHVLWQRKAAILQSKFGVVWYSPAAMNPDVLID